MMQAQGNIRIFSSIHSCPLNFHLIKSNTFCALPGYVIITDGLNRQMPARQTIQIMRQMRFQHIRLQQCIVRNAVQHDSMIGKYMPVVLQVLPHLEFIRILQPRLESLQHLFSIQLCRYSLILMRQRDVRCLAGFNTQRNTHQFSFHWIQTGCFSVN